MHITKYQFSDSEYPQELPKGSILHGKEYDYVVEAELGRGSFGITYLVKARMKNELETIDTNRFMAVKEFFWFGTNGRGDKSLETESIKKIYLKYKEEFVQEALNISKLNHPNIIKVGEIFYQNDTVYYTMEYFPEGSLNSHIIKNLRLSQPRTILVAKQICLALDHMHSRGIVHLDLKPSNIVIQEDKIVLIDFGLSKQFDGFGHLETCSQIGCGTQGYAPLEQGYFKKWKDVPYTIDIYALGATMYKMITGITPPEAYELLNEAFPMKDFDKADCCQELISIIAKCMAPRRKERYQTVREVFHALDNLPQYNPNTDSERQNQVLQKNEIKFDGTNHINNVINTHNAISRPLLSFPEIIQINYSRSDKKGYSYFFTLSNTTIESYNSANHVEIWRDGEKIHEHFFGNHIPKDIEDFIRNHDYLISEHWENYAVKEVSPLPFNYDIAVNMFWEEEIPFKRVLTNINYNCKLFADVRYLIEKTSLQQEVDTFIYIDSLNSQKHHTGEVTLQPVRVYDETDSIRISYMNQTPIYFGAYTMHIEKNKVSVFSNQPYFNFNSAQCDSKDYSHKGIKAACAFIPDKVFFNVADYLRTLKFKMPPKKFTINDASEYPATFEVGLSIEGREYASYYSQHIGRMHFGSLQGLPWELSKNVTKLIPNFDKLLAEAEKKQSSGYMTKQWEEEKTNKYASKQKRTSVLLSYKTFLVLAILIAIFVILKFFVI